MTTMVVVVGCWDGHLAFSLKFYQSHKLKTFGVVSKWLYMESLVFLFMRMSNF